jgi:signal transduction histidine kinase
MGRGLFRLLQNEGTQLYKKSVIPRFFSIRRWTINDRVTALCASPLGMFFYNQRAILYGLSGLYILILFALAVFSRFPNQPTKIAILLAFGWWFGFLFTILRHRHFIQGLLKWADSPTAGELPEVFDIYFVVDSALLLALFIAGRLLSLPIDQLLLVVFGNFFVYSTYIGGERQHRYMPLAAALIVTIAAATWFTPADTSKQLLERGLFRFAFEAGPFVALLVVTPASASMISWLRSMEHDVTKQRLELFGRYATALSDGPPSPLRHDANDNQPSQEEVRKRARTVITDLCKADTELGYTSARMLLLQTHRDRGRLLVPYVQVNISPLKPIPDDGLIDFFAKTGSFLRYSTEPIGGPLGPEAALLLSPSPDIVAHAIVPLSVHNHAKGLLFLYGSTNGTASFPQEKVFLDSLRKMIAGSMEEWDALFGLDAHSLITSLHSCATLDEVFKKAAAILRECLSASACMIAFRPNPEKGDLTIVAANGFKNPSFSKDYPGPESKTAESALGGITIRYDDVEMHRTEFKQTLLEQLEKNLGNRVQSWMAIPIGTKEHSYGAIKVINNRSYCRWFTDHDEALAKDLAIQLHTIIERFRYIEEIKTAQQKIARHLEFASAAQAAAEQTARQRQEDIMIISHQLQGPLASLVGSLWKIKHQVYARDWKAIQNSFDAIRETIEDAITLSYGVVTTFAKDAGRPTSLDEVEVDAPRELRLLAERLQKTNAREDLTFEFILERDFPTIKIDKSVFISVFYSLLHNAMKYADEHTTVTLECSKERSTGHSALKVKTVGEPILPSEKEKIFDKYQRGSVIARTGRHHSGVGIGLWVARQLISDAGGTIRVEVNPVQPRFAVFIVEI